MEEVGGMEAVSGEAVLAATAAASEDREEALEGVAGIMAAVMGGGTTGADGAVEVTITIRTTMEGIMAGHITAHPMALMTRIIMGRRTGTPSASAGTVGAATAHEEATLAAAEGA